MSLGSLLAGIRLALDTVRAHKLRSFLTVLGVIIGTGAVIGVGSIIAGLDGAITNILRSFGPNTIIVTKTAAMEYALDKIRVNCVNPVFSPDTSLSAEFAGGALTDEAKKRFLSTIPLGAANG